jgi:hypothetical protein
MYLRDGRQRELMVVAGLGGRELRRVVLIIEAVIVR